MMYLYVKTHNITGLKYLGKTKGDPFKYKGSGVKWTHHIRKHGYNVNTIILLATEDTNELKETGLFFSRLWNIVLSDEWANLTEEEGQGGNTWDKRGRVISEEARLKMSITRKGRKFTPEHRANMNKQPWTEERKLAMSQSKLGVKRPKRECPYCNQSISVGNYSRWHGDNCRNRFT